MSKEEETVFETLNRHLSEIKDELVAANEALIVIAIELYESRRDFTDILKKMNTLLAKLVEAEVPVTTKEVSAIQDTERFKKMVLPSEESAGKEVQE